MTVKELETLYDYSYWANAKLFPIVASLSTEDFCRNVAGGWGSVQHTLVHMMSAEGGWLERAGGPRRGAPLKPDDFPTLPSVSTYWAVQEEKVRAFLASLSDADLDRVVVHEWAHVQRRDDLTQHVQWLVRVVAGWHPALWWLGRQMDLEREVACDEIAVSQTGTAKGYAQCLVTLAGLSNGPARPLPVLAVSPSRLQRRLVRRRVTEAHFPRLGGAGIAGGRLWHGLMGVPDLCLNGFPRLPQHGKGLNWAGNGFRQFRRGK